MKTQKQKQTTQRVTAREQSDSKVTQMSGLSDRGFKITMIHVLKVPVEKKGNSNEQMRNLSRETEMKEKVAKWKGIPQCQ